MAEKKPKTGKTPEPKPAVIKTAAKKRATEKPKPARPAAEPANAKKSAKKAVKKAAKKVVKKTAPKAAAQPVPASKTTKRSAAAKPAKPDTKSKSPAKKTAKKGVVKVLAAAASVVKSVVKKVAARKVKGPAEQPARKSAPRASGKQPAPRQPAWQSAVKSDTQAASVVPPAASMPKPKPATAGRKSAPAPGPAQPVPMIEDNALPSPSSRMVLMLRDPKWLCVYWELDPADSVRHRVGSLVGAPILIVRVHQSGPNSRMLDFTVLGRARTWYIPIDAQRGSWRAELGYIGPRGKFVTIIASNELALQPEEPKPAAPPAAAEVQESQVPALESVAVKSAEAQSAAVHTGPQRTDVEEVAGWASPITEQDGWADLYLPPLTEFPGSSEQLAGGGPLGGASEMAAAMQAPPGASEQFLPGPAGEAALRKPGARGFWLRVATELILYGATEPDASVTVQGMPVRLREDGTFSLRFALPDGLQELPVHAQSADGIDEQTITPIVRKETV